MNFYSIRSDPPSPTVVPCQPQVVQLMFIRDFERCAIDDLAVCLERCFLLEFRSSQLRFPGDIIFLSLCLLGCLRFFRNGDNRGLPVFCSWSPQRISPFLDGDRQTALPAALKKSFLHLGRSASCPPVD